MDAPRILDFISISIEELFWVTDGATNVVETRHLLEFLVGRMGHCADSSWSIANIGTGWKTAAP